MRTIMLVGIGGFCGAALRYIVSGKVQQICGSTLLPYGTLVVNGLGSFVLGIIFWLGIERGLFGPSFRAFASIGLLGGFTTFSTFSVETVNLLSVGARWAALANVLANVAVCLAAVIAARWIVVAVWD